ncbi:Peptidyl-prolyl cis-trans isomerase cyp10 [Coemansia sp. Benny D115]|nr:Peptidyl-prolyl cis-trans isomerase cyp10 [Coemansia sp. Benny D115]
MSVTLHTDLGDLKLEVFCSQVPKASENFLALCASNYYDDTLIHRNIRGFIVQMGDPTGTGKGGTSIWGRKFEDEITPSLKHDRRGTLSMASSGPDTNGSQFFITYDRQPSLDSKYTIFGRVIDGWDVLDALERVEVKGKKSRPVEDVRLKGVTIHANPLADPGCIQ